MTTKVKAPGHLTASTKRWWHAVVGEYALEPHHLHLLELAGSALDRAIAAREILNAEGLTFIDRFGSPRARPEIGIERDSRLAFARLLRELDLDAAPGPEPSRPPSVPRVRRSRAN